MAEKTLNTRIIHKHDTEINWSKATNFKPKQGEIIIYDKDNNYNYERIKVGDGVTLVNNLPFYGSSIENISDGIASGSVRTSSSTTESTDYKLGTAAFAEGSATKAGGNFSHAEGYKSNASGAYSHAEGRETTASGSVSHAEGTSTVASGIRSHSSGYGTIANGENQTAIGKYNVQDNSNEFAFIIGNGTSAARSNAFTVDWNGNAKAGGKKLATETYVEGKIAGIPTPDVSGQIETHNSSSTAHSDIRRSISEKASNNDLTSHIGDSNIHTSATEKAYWNAKASTDIATKSSNGLMSSTDKSKLDGIATGANKTVVDSALSSTSTNPVQNKVINTAISNLNTLVGNTAVATQISTAIASKADLDTNGKVPSSQLPSYVDDVIEYNGKSNFPSTGESGKIYVDTATNLTYRWSGSAYVEISPSLALGETSSTAYRGDRGKTAYDHSQSTHARTDATKTEKSSTNGNIKINGTETTVYTHPGSGTNPHGTTKSDVGLGNVGNFKAVSTVASQGLTDTEKSNARANIGAGTSSFSGNYNDLTNKPTIPTVGNGTITIKQAGTSKGTFTVNQSGDTTIELTDSNTDTKVTQTVTTSDANYPLLLAPSGQTATSTTTSYFDSGVTLNPNTNTIAANISGNAGSASKLGTNAGSATQPVYFSNGVPVATSYSLAKSVPSNAVFTDTKVTAVGNHYTPSGGDTTSASGGTLTDITNSSSGVQVVTGVTKDAAGHVTGVTSVALKSTNTNTDTKVTQGAAITTAGEYPVLLGYSTANSSVTDTVNKTSTLKYNPNTQVLTVPKISDGTKTTSITDLVNIVLTNVSVATSAWTSSTTYSDYPYQASITVSGCTSSHVPEVVFSPSDASSGIFAPVCSSSTNTVTIYATEKPSAAITILTVECRK